MRTVLGLLEVQVGGLTGAERMEIVGPISNQPRAGAKTSVLGSPWQPLPTCYGAISAAFTNFVQAPRHSSESSPRTPRIRFYLFHSHGDHPSRSNFGPPVLFDNPRSIVKLGLTHKRGAAIVTSFVNMPHPRRPKGRRQVQNAVADRRRMSFKFLDLPPEIRLMIYEILVRDYLHSSDKLLPFNSARFEKGIEFSDPAEIQFERHKSFPRPQLSASHFRPVRYEHVSCGADDLSTAPVVTPLDFDPENKDLRDRWCNLRQTCHQINDEMMTQLMSRKPLAIQYDFGIRAWEWSDRDYFMARLLRERLWHQQYTFRRPLPLEGEQPLNSKRRCWTVYTICHEICHPLMRSIMSPYYDRISKLHVLIRCMQPRQGQDEFRARLPSAGLDLSTIRQCPNLRHLVLSLQHFTFRMDGSNEGLYMTYQSPRKSLYRPVDYRTVRTIDTTLLSGITLMMLHVIASAPADVNITIVAKGVEETPDSVDEIISLCARQSLKLLRLICAGNVAVRDPSVREATRLINEAATMSIDTEVNQPDPSTATPISNPHDVMNAHFDQDIVHVMGSNFLLMLRERINAAQDGERIE